MKMKNTQTQYKSVIDKCRTLFLKKNTDYGSAWRILRPSSLTDQIFIKAQRIRTIQEVESKVDEGEEPEFVGIVNYCVMAQIQLELPSDGEQHMPVDELMKLYDKKVEDTFSLMEAKNHDYGEAWRDMRISSLTDLILMKLFRTKQIEDNDGKTIVSEGLDANYKDMMNYAIFALIKFEELSA
jgi:hypothetical protein